MQTGFHSTDARSVAAEWVTAFTAGFLAVLLFHQPALWLLAQAGLTQGEAYSFKPVAPFALPRVVSAAFWGGVWGLIMHAFARHWRGPGHLMKALLFGMVFPTLVAWFIVAPIKGLPVAAGGKFDAMLTGLCVNAAWGFGTAVLLGLFHGRIGAGTGMDQGRG